MTTPDLRSSQWLKSNLAALGSAAVLTVYAAGWARTKAAADLLDEQAERGLPPHRPAARATTGEVAGTPVRRTPELPTVAASVESPAPVATKPSAAAQSTNANAPAATAAGTSVAKAAPTPQPSAGATTTSAPSATSTTTAAATKPQPVTPTASTTAPTNPSPAPTSTATAATTSASPATPANTAPTQSSAIVPGAPRDLATDAQATTAAAKATDAPAGPAAYKDGLYSGWGTSRHGDIEAYVEIKGGKITSAFISECLTQYSCSWIAKLPPMVIEAQSAEIDYISGATHSSNAFYYAIVNALKKAR